jgi:hypothetical protein
MKRARDIIATGIAIAIAFGAYALALGAGLNP